MKKSIISFLFFIALISPLCSQSGIKLTDYYFNPIQYNPAYTGVTDGLFIKATHTSQWLGFDDAPTTQTFDAQSRFSRGRYAAGISILNDNFGAVRNLNFETNFALHLKADEDIGFALGLKAGLNNFSIDYARLNIFNPAEFVYSGGNLSELKPVIGAGFYLYSKNWFFGMSIPNFLSHRLEDELNRSIYNKLPHFYATTGFDLIINDDLLLKSQLLMQVVKGVPISLLVTNKFIYKDKFGIGLHFQPNALYGAFTNFKLSQEFQITYGYDAALSDLSQYATGNHYFGISYNLGQPKGCCGDDLDTSQRIYIVE